MLVHGQAEHLAAEQCDAWVFHVTSRYAPVIGSKAGPGVEVCQRFSGTCNAPASCCINSARHQQKTRSARPKRVHASALAIPGLPPRLQAEIKSAWVNYSTRRLGGEGDWAMLRRSMPRPGGFLTGLCSGVQPFASASRRPWLSSVR
jgi:hypothetical protein